MVAKKLLDQREEEIAQGKVAGIYFDRLKFDELADDLLNEYKVDGRKSIVQVTGSVNHLREFFGGMKVKDVTTAKVNEYITTHHLGDFAPATINRQLSALKRMLNIGAKETPPKIDRVPTSPCSKREMSGEVSLDIQIF